MPLGGVGSRRAKPVVTWRAQGERVPLATVRRVAGMDQAERRPRSAPVGVRGASGLADPRAGSGPAGRHPHRPVPRRG